MIKLTVRDAIEVQLAIPKVPKLIAKSAYWLARIAAACAVHGRAFERKRNAMIREQGVFDEKTKNYSIPPDQFADYNENVEKMMDENIEIEFKKLKVDELVDVNRKPIEIEAATMAGLMSILDGEDGNPTGAPLSVIK